MSLHMNVEKARLTVLGTGWSNTSLDSGDGFTVDGELWNDVATDLGYDFGDDVDWDLVADNDWSQVIYEDSDGNFYNDYDGDGVWTDSEGREYPGGGSTWLPEDMLVGVSDQLNDLAVSDSQLARYSIPNDVLPTLYGGKVTTEIHPTVTGSDRPHTYLPPVWYIQQGGDGIIFLDEPFVHGTASGGNITVYDEAISIRDGSSKAIYWSNCTTQFSPTALPSPYNSYPIQYVCWQCIYGSLSDALISTNPNTITSEDIKNGNSGLPTITLDGKKCYKI